MRYACLRVPNLPVAVARRDTPGLGERPVVILGGAGADRERVIACSRAARRAGVEVGMRLSQAIARCPEAAYLPHHAQAVSRAHEQLHRLLGDFAPEIEVVGAAHFHADVSGMPGLARLPDEAWAIDAFEGLHAGSGLPVHMGFADRLFVAHSVAMMPRLPATLDALVPAPSARGRLVYVAGGLEDAVLSRLPIEILPVDADIIARLRLFGITQLGQVARLPLGALQAQFGPDGARIWRLARGREDLALSPAPEALTLDEQCELPAPAVALAPLMHVTGLLLDRLLGRPEIRRCAIRQVDWIASLEDGDRIEHTVTFRTPTADRARMAAAIRARVERLPFTAPVTDVHLRATAIGREHAEQGQLWRSGPRNRAQLLDAAEQLAVRCGGPQIWRIVELEPRSRIPERRMGLVPLR